MDKDGKPTGILVDIIKEIFEKELKYKVVYEQLPWKRCQRNVLEGSTDFMLTVPTDVRKKYTNVSQKPIYVLNTTIYTYNEHPRLKEIEAIKNVGDIIKSKFEVISYIGNGWFKQNITNKGVKSALVKNYDLVLRGVARKRADFTIDIEPTTNLNIKRLGLVGKVIQTKVNLKTMNLHFLISKKSKHQETLDAYNKIYEKIEKSGRLNEILAKY